MNARREALALLCMAAAACGDDGGDGTGGGSATESSSVAGSNGTGSANGPSSGAGAGTASTSASSSTSSDGTGGGTSGPGGTTGTGGEGTGAGSTSGVGGGEPLPVNECDSPGADWVFCSGFEEGNKDVWDDYDGNPDETNLLMEDPGPFANAGNHVMRMRAPEGRGGVDLVKVLPEAHDKLYARWYIQYEPGFDFDAPNHGGGLHAGNRDWLGHSDTQPNGTDWYTAWIEPDPAFQAYNIYSYYAGMYMDCADPNGACWGDHFPCRYDEGTNYCTNPEHREGPVPPTMETGKWYCVELMMDGGTPSNGPEGASGALDFWVDDQEIGPWENLFMRSTDSLDIGILWLNLFHHEEHSVEGVMYDHVVVSTSRIGCGG